MQERESLEVASVFFVPKSPGRVYFEARSLEGVRALCHGMVFLYFRSNVFVPLTERIALLEVGKTDPLIEAGNWVKVRDGRYKDDTGKVVSVVGNCDAVVVALKSREKLPNVSSSKRKRGQGRTRPNPYLFTKDKATGLSEGAEIKVADDVFKFGGKSYTTEGYLLLQLRSDRVQRILTGIAAHDLFVTTESSNALKEHLKPPKIVNGVAEPPLPFTLSSTEVAIPAFSQRWQPRTNPGGSL